MIKKVGKDIVKVGVSQKDLEDSISGFSALKPILQAQVIKSNGANKRQAAICAAELDWKHGDKKSKEFRKLIDSL